MNFGIRQQIRKIIKQSKSDLNAVDKMCNNAYRSVNRWKHQQETLRMSIPKYNDAINRKLEYSRKKGLLRLIHKVANKPI